MPLLVDSRVKPGFLGRAALGLHAANLLGMHRFLVRFSQASLRDDWETVVTGLAQGAFGFLKTLIWDGEDASHHKLGAAQNDYGGPSSKPKSGKTRRQDAGSTVGRCDELQTMQVWVPPY